MFNAATPPVVDWATWPAEIDALRVREGVHREGDTLAATRRRLPMVELGPGITLIAAGRSAPAA